MGVLLTISHLITQKLCGDGCEVLCDPREQLDCLLIRKARIVLNDSFSEKIVEGREKSWTMFVHSVNKFWIIPSDAEIHVISAPRFEVVLDFLDLAALTVSKDDINVISSSLMGLLT